MVNVERSNYFGSCMFSTLVYLTCTGTVETVVVDILNFKKRFFNSTSFIWDSIIILELHTLSEEFNPSWVQCFCYDVIL